MLARRNLQAVLRRLSVLQEHMKIEDQAVFEALFKNVWADHADMISIQYTGTGALKTDFTRTGKRTKMGLLEDGRRSLIRYYKNNFADGFRQVKYLHSRKKTKALPQTRTRWTSLWATTVYHPRKE